MSKQNEQELIKAKEYFDKLKASKETVTDTKLKQFYDNALVLLNKAVRTGQVLKQKKLMFFIDIITKEHELLELGIDTYVNKSEIDNYIKKVNDRAVKIVELKNYQREIPDEAVEAVEKTKDVFDEFYVVFTDYTDVHKDDAKRREVEKDPILFGAFIDRTESKQVHQRFYFLADWIDEYCDLTLGKMLEEIKDIENRDVEMKISTPEDLDAIRDRLKRTKSVRGEWVEEHPDAKEVKKTFFGKVRSSIKKK